MKKFCSFFVLLMPLFVCNEASTDPVGDRRKWLRRSISVNRQQIDEDPQLAATWFLCYRHGEVQACRNYAKQTVQSTQSQFQEQNLNQDSRSQCHQRTCVHGTCRHNECVCNEGWTGNSCSEDINECMLRTHRCSQLCSNTLGGYLCLCLQHYSLQIDQLSCVRKKSLIVRDINSHSGKNVRGRSSEGKRQQSTKRGKRISFDIERIVPRRDFSAILNGNANSSSTPLSFFLAQVETSGKSAMKSIDSFLTKINAFKRRFPGLSTRRNPCHRLRCAHKCVLVSPYSARCVCRRGYVLQGGRVCVDRNECKSEVQPCGNNSVCVNKLGSYKCQCNVGYAAASEQISSKQNCEDINECLTGEHICSDEATCINMPGYHRCVCPPGVVCESTVRDNSTTSRENFVPTQQVYSSASVSASQSSALRGIKLKRRQGLLQASHRHLDQTRRKNTELHKRTNKRSKARTLVQEN